MNGFVDDILCFVSDNTKIKVIGNGKVEVFDSKKDVNLPCRFVDNIWAENNMIVIRLL